ncbi:hypothetical protein [Haladaptatus cibarius]|uniref:hypothetical protein n=1 Tax=Haladaptatus cibarius TaxID=453847 RepID=UPI0006799754|nr:hypothetical protein [Haladaptatus cibarius]
MDEETKREADKFTFDSFLKNNSEYFVVMGVFAALAIYIRQMSGFNSIREAGTATQFSFFTSFLMGLLVIALFYKQMSRKLGSLGELAKAHRLSSNIDLTLFTSLLTLTLVGLWEIIIPSGGILFLIVTTGLALLLLILFLNVLQYFGSIVPYTPKWRILMGLTVCLTVLIISTFSLEYLQTSYQITDVKNLSVQGPKLIAIDLLFFIAATSQSIASIGVIASVVSIPIVIIDKIRGTSPYDEVKRTDIKPDQNKSSMKSNSQGSEKETDLATRRTNLRKTIVNASSEEKRQQAMLELATLDREEHPECYEELKEK